MKAITLKKFENLVGRGKLHKVTGQEAPGEELCETPFEHGVANGYTLADICHFYAHRRGYDSKKPKGWSDTHALEAGYEEFLNHVLVTAATLIQRLPSLRKAGNKVVARK